MPYLDPSDHALPPKLKLEEIERNFATAKEKIQVMNQLTMQEIMRWIEILHAVMIII